MVTAEGDVGRKLPLDARRIEESVRTLERKPSSEPFGVGRDRGHEVTDDLHYITGVSGVGDEGAGESFGQSIRERVGHNLDGSLKGGQQNESKKSDAHGAGLVMLEM